MNSKYAKFFEPLKINKMVLKNRFAMAPMGTFTEESNGYYGPRTMDYYEERAKGGAGLIIPEVQYVTTKLEKWLSHMTIVDTDFQMKVWDELADRVHSHGAKLCLQLGCGLGKNAFAFDGDGGEIVSSSENESYYVKGKYARPMTVEEIHETVAAFGRAARRCVVAGVDAIEIHAHQGYILDQFMTACWNRRTDEYGGSFENRMRFVTEVYQIIRENVGPDFPIMIRMAAAHDFEGGRTLEDTIKIAKYLEKLGIDAFDLNMGAYESKKWLNPTPYYDFSATSFAAAAIKKEVHVPIINAGSHTIDSAAKLLDEGAVDVIMMGRQMIADPELPNKVFRDCEEDVRPCLYCNSCSARLYQNLPLACAINTQAAAEGRYKITKTDSPRKIVVIGGGPSGMEAARVAALQGHKVTLYEKSDRLGGQLNPASAPPFKNRLKAFSEWEQCQLHKLGVEICLNHPIDENSPELADAHRIIVGIGASPIIPRMEGIDQDHIIEVTEAHANPALVKGDTILLAGGGQSGCDAALEYAMQGKKVTIVEMKDRIAAEEWLEDNRIPLDEKIKQYNVNVLLNTKILHFTENGACVEMSDGSKAVLEADTIITAFGMRPQKDLAERICAKYSNAAVSVGDCTGLGRIYGAVRKGFLAAYTVGDDIY